MSFDQKFSKVKSDTYSSSFEMTTTKAKDSLEALILKTKKKEEGLKKSCRDKKEIKEAGELMICCKGREMTRKLWGASTILLRI